MSKFDLPIPEMPPSTPDLFEDLSPELVRSAREQAMQALILADITRLPTPACQALTDAVWLGEWATDQPVAYPASPHAVAARRAWRNDMLMTASLLTHSGYLPHLDPLPEPDRSMISAHPAPEGWSHPDWEIAAAIYTLATTLRSGLRSWGDAPMADLRGDQTQAKRAREVAVATGKLVSGDGSHPIGSVRVDDVAAMIEFLTSHKLLGDKKTPKAAEVCVPLAQ